MFEISHTLKCDVLCVLCIQSQTPARCYTATRHAPLQLSLSLPVGSYIQTDLTATGGVESLKVSAPKVAARRTQSIAESCAVNQNVGKDSQGMSKQASMAAPARYKTELCRPFDENGACRYGSKCQFAHGKAELRSVKRHPKYKTDLCRTFHTTGLCPYGPRCHFIHNDDERRTSTDSAPDQLCTSLEDRPRLQRHCSEYQSTAVTRGPKHGSSAEIQRRASSVADKVIRNSVGYQQRLRTVVESNQLTVGSVAADSFSSASSVTDSPSPSPTLHSSAATEDLVAVNSDQIRAALLTQIVSRLRPHEIAALLSALQLPNSNAVSAAGTTGGLLPRGVVGEEKVDTTGPQWQPDVWTHNDQNYPHHPHQKQQQQQQQLGTTTNVCW